MRENSIFAILLRSPWWISLLVAAAIGLIARAAMPAQYANAAWFAGGPFIIIACIAGWRQLTTIGKKRASRILDAVATMPWSEFSAALTHAFEREGYVVTRLSGEVADFEIVLGGKSALVCGKRWKAATLGMEPLRDLKTAADHREAAGRIYIAMGEVSESARRFATQNKIDVLQGQRLAELMRDVGK